MRDYLRQEDAALHLQDQCRVIYIFVLLPLQQLLPMYSHQVGDYDNLHHKTA